MILLRMDAPAGYVCRITRSDILQMPTNVKCFEQALKCIVLTWKAKVSINTFSSHQKYSCLPNLFFFILNFSV